MKPKIKNRSKIQIQLIKPSSIEKLTLKHQLRNFGIQQQSHAAQSSIPVLNQQFHQLEVKISRYLGWFGFEFGGNVCSQMFKIKACEMSRCIEKTMGQNYCIIKLFYWKQMLGCVDFELLYELVIFCYLDLINFFLLKKLTLFM